MKTRMTTNSLPFRALALCASLAVSAHAQTVWQGAGAGGSGATSSNWNNGANWTAGMPTNVDVKIDFSSAGQVIVNQAGLTNAGFVTVTNADGETPIKSLRISQDITFDGIEITPGSSSRYGLRIDGNRVLTLSGNGAVLRVNADTTTKAQQIYNQGTVRFTGTNVVLGTGLSNSLAINLSTAPGATWDFATSNATINMAGRSIAIGSQNGKIMVNGGQTWISNSAGFDINNSVTLTNTGSAPLNWVVAPLRWNWSASGSNAMFMPGGTYDSIALDIGGSSANKAILNLVGDVIAGGTVFSGLRLYNNSATGTSVVSLASSTLQVTNAGSGVRVGYQGSGAGILDVGSGKLATVNSVLLGEGGSTANAILLGNGGRLQVTNASASGLLELRKGTMVMTSNSSVIVDKLLVGGAQGFLQFNGGTLASRSTGVSNGVQFVVGDGISSATFQMLGSGTHSFTNGVLVSANASLKVTNAQATVVASTVTNLGTVSVMNGQATFNGNVVNLGAWVSDPSTNTFNGNYTVGATGYVSAASNDVYAFGGDFIMASTNHAFNLASAHVVFATNGYGLATTTANHLLSVSNSGALDIGQGYTNFSQVASDFAIGALSIQRGDKVTLAGNKDATRTNALYVGWLDVQGSFDTNNYSAVTNALVLALNLPNINLYYDKYDPRNGWLNANLINDSAAGYNLWGNNGLLLPIPEPSAFLALALGAGALAFLRRNRNL